MRKNIGKAIEETADLYEKVTESYFSSSSHQQHQEDITRTTLYQKSPYTTFSAAPPDTNPNTTGTLNGSRRNSAVASFYSTSNNKKRFSFKETIRRAFSTRPPESNNMDIQEQQMLENLEDSDNNTFDQKTLKGISTGAYKILTQLQTESNRLKNVSTEYTIQTVFHFFGSGKQRCLKDLRRAKRYNQAIDAMKSIVWPLTSFRLMLPLVTYQIKVEEAEAIQKDQLQYIQNQQVRYITPEIVACFSDSISVMRQLAAILKEKDKPLSIFLDEWAFMDRMVTAGSHFIQRELRELVKYSEGYDNIKLLSYYGLIVRCSVIWEGLRTILDKLSPLNGTLSRASSLGTLPNREPLHAAE